MSKYVHNLVSKMTMREKGYFRSMHSDAEGQEKNYLKLYEWIEKNPKYDPAKTALEFKDTSMGKYISSEYNYLGKQLLKSLVNFHFNSSEINKTQQSILFIQILVKKNLKEKALKILKHVKKKAYDNELFYQVLNLIDLEEKILFNQGILGFAKYLIDLENERLELLSKINNLSSLRLLREQIRELWFQSGFLASAPIENEIYLNPILNSEENALSKKAKIHWYYVVAMKAFIVKKHDRAMELFSKAISFLEANQKLFPKNILLAYYSNYLYNAALAKKSKEFQKMYSRLNSFDSNLYTQYISYSRKIELFYQLKEIKKCNTLARELLPFIKKNKNRLESTQSNYLFFLLVRSNLLDGKFEKSLDHLNSWMEIKVIDYYQLHLKLFRLIIYLELNLIEILKFEIQSSTKALKRHKQFNTTAKCVIKFFKNYVKAPEKELKQLKLLASQLNDSSPSFENEKDYNYFDYSLWVEDRIRRITIDSNVLS